MALELAYAGFSAPLTIIFFFCMWKFLFLMLFSLILCIAGYFALDAGYRLVMSWMFMTAGACNVELAKMIWGEFKG